jgi:hypothetical protein
MIKTFVERNVIDLNPGRNGTLSTDNILDVRADSAGMLDVGPISLGAELDASSQVVEAEFRASGRRADGTNRSETSTRFRFTFADQGEPRFWRIFTGQLDYAPSYEYRVHVTVKGTLFNVERPLGDSGRQRRSDGLGARAAGRRRPAPQSQGTRDLRCRHRRDRAHRGSGGSSGGCRRRRS